MSIYSTMDWLLQLGSQDGMERGLRAGRCMQLGKLLLRHGRKKFGPPTDSEKNLVDQLADNLGLEQLEQAAGRFGHAVSWSVLLADLVPTARPADPDWLLPYTFNPDPMPPSVDTYATASRKGKPIAIHMRYQRIYQENLGLVLYREAQQLRRKHGHETMTCVTLLWEGADGPGVTGEYEIPGGGVFTYHVARLWEREVEESLAPIPILVLSTLAKGASERLPEVIAAIEKGIAASGGTEKEKLNLWYVVYTSMGLRYPAALVNELLADQLPALLQCEICRDIRSNGYYSGFSQGEVLGAAQVVREWIRQRGQEHLGTIPTEIEQALEKITALDRLEQIASRVVKARTWPESLSPG